MSILRTPKIAAVLFVTLAFAASSCDYLRDTEPFTQTLEYNPGPAGGVMVSPVTFRADAGFGEIQLVNNTQQRHGFAIKELGVFEEILAKRTRTFAVEEARDGHSYTFYCHLHDGEIQGTMQVKYLTEEERG